MIHKSTTSCYFFSPIHRWNVLLLRFSSPFSNHNSHRYTESKLLITLHKRKWPLPVSIGLPLGKKSNFECIITRALFHRVAPARFSANNRKHNCSPFGFVILPNWEEIHLASSFAVEFHLPAFDAGFVVIPYSTLASARPTSKLGRNC